MGHKLEEEREVLGGKDPLIPQTFCPLGKDTVVGGESEQCPVKCKAQGRDPTCPSLRLVLLKSGHCLSTLGKELTAWRK